MKIRYGKGRCMWTKCAGKVGTKLEWLHFWDFKLTLTTKKMLEQYKKPGNRKKVTRSVKIRKFGNSQTYTFPTSNPWTFYIKLLL